jgi:hypothetical protein
VEPISQVRQQLVEDYFPLIQDLRTQVQVALWSDHHLVTKSLFDLLPFGRTLGPDTFYSYVDHQLPNVIEQARRNLLYWSLSGARQFGGFPAQDISVFYDDTFLWHYYVPAKAQEIRETLQNGHRVRFLSRFYLSQTKVEVEFNEIRLSTEVNAIPVFVYTDSKDYCHTWSTGLLEVTITNHELRLINPRTYTLPPSAPNTLGRDAAYQEQLDRILGHPDDLRIDAQYWNSVDSTRVSSPDPDLDSTPDLVISRASTPESEYHRS